MRSPGGVREWRELRRSDLRQRSGERAVPGDPLQVRRVLGAQLWLGASSGDGRRIRPRDAWWIADGIAKSGQEEASYRLI